MWFKKTFSVPVEVSGRHCHLAEEDLEKLFGKGYELKKMRQLSQPSEFACQETVTLYFGAKKIENIRIVGPVRAKTQVEISLGDSFSSGVTPPIRLSGDLEGSSGMKLEGPKGSVDLNEGLIVALRHIHCATDEAAKLGLKNNDKVTVKIGGKRALVFENVLVRIKDGYKLGMHLDTDEGNAAGIDKIIEGQVIK